MYNITTIKGGFVMNALEYIFEGEADILNDEQAHVPTDKGVILVDTSMTINENSYTNINDFLLVLYA